MNPVQPKTDDKYEKLKMQYNKEMHKLADYIVRFERKLSAKDHELLDWKGNLKSNEPFIQGFNEMWKDQVR